MTLRGRKQSRASGNEVDSEVKRSQFSKLEILIVLLCLAMGGGSLWYIKHVQLRRATTEPVASSDLHHLLQKSQNVISVLDVSSEYLSNDLEREYFMFVTDKFHRTIINNERLNITESMKILRDARTLSSGLFQMIITTPIDYDTNDESTRFMPLLHHCIKLYFQSLNSRDSRQIVSLMLYLIENGADVNTKYANDPSLLFKAILLREIHLASVIVTHGAIEKKPSATESLPNIWRIIYTVNCEVVTLAKLFLNINTELADGLLTPAVGESEDELIRDRMKYGVKIGSTANINGADLMALSPHFNSSILHQLKHPTRHNGYKIYDSIQSISETAGYMHAQLMANIVKEFGIVYLIEFVTAVTDKLTNRNALHFVTISGGYKFVQDLTNIVTSEKRDLGTQENARIRTLLATALTAVDSRGKTALFYSHYRYGMETGVHREILKLCQAIDLICSESFDKGIGIKEGDMRDGRIDTVTGGWDTTQISFRPDEHVRVGQCDVEVRYDMPSEYEFYNNYLYQSKPVLLRGVALGTKIRQSFRKDAFIKRYSNDSAPISSIPYADSFGYDNDKTNIDNLIEYGVGKSGIDSTVSEVDRVMSAGKEYDVYDPLYIFYESNNKLLTDVEVPSCWGKNRINNLAYQLYMGPKGSGAPAHYHGHAMNTLAYGKKHWLLYRPIDTFYTTTTYSSYRKFILNGTYKSGDDNLLYNLKDTKVTIQCTQEAGDILYIPSLWGHGTVNLQQSVGVAMEVMSEQFCME